MKTLTLAAVLLAVAPASAKVDVNRWMKSYPLRLGSHTLTVTGRTGSARLLLDAAKVAEASAFPLDLAGNGEGIPMAAIWADRGGASCYDGTEMLFAAPAGQSVVRDKVDGTSCQARPKVGEGNGELVIVDPPVKPAGATPAVAASPGAAWLFDARHGAQRVMAIGPEGPDSE